VATSKEKALKAANRFLQRGQVDKAIREFERLADTHDQDPRLRHKLGELYARKLRVGEALEAFKWVASHYEQGGFYLKATAVYKQMLELDPERLDVHLHLGEIYRSQGKTSEASFHFGTVADRVESEGSLSEKIGLYERLIRINPEDHDAFNRLVSLHVDAGSHATAVELLETMADTMRAAGDTELLLAALDRLCSIAEETEAYSREIAQLQLDAGKPRAAVNRLQVCFRADPRDTTTLSLLGRAFKELGQTEKAIQVYGELARIHGARGELEAQVEVEQTLRHLVDQSGDEDGGGLGGVSTSLTLRQDVPDAALQHIVRGETYLKYGLAERARGASVTALKRWPKLFDVQRLQAAVAEERGERSKAADAALQMYGIAMDAGDLLVARRCLQEGIRHRPGDETIRNRLTAFDETMGDELAAAGRAPESAAAAATDDGAGSNLRDEIDVDIDEVFTRPDSFTDGNLESGGNDLEALDENSLEVLTYENYLSEVATDVGDAEGTDAADADREIRIETDSEDAQDTDDLDDSEDFEALLSEVASAIENEVKTGTEEGTEDSVDPAAVTGGSGSSMEIARGYYEVGLYEEALRELANAAGGDQSAQALLQMGRCHVQLSQWDNAIECLQQGLAEVGDDDPLFLDLQFEIGHAYQHKGEGWAAYEAFGEIAQRDPSYRSDEVTGTLEQIAEQLGVGEG